MTGPLSARGLMCCLAVLTPCVSAQGFAVGDVFLKSPAVTGGSSVDGAVMRIDPANGNAQMIVDFKGGAYTQDSIAYDPYRDKLVFVGVVGAVGNPQELYLADAQGNLQSLGFQGTTFGAFAPTGDGRIYMQQTAVSRSRVVYLDASDRLQTLFDESGQSAFDFSPPGGFFQYAQLIYHAETNSLVALAPTGQSGCGGQVSTTLNIRRAQLSADGRRVVGPVACGAFEVSSSGETPVGLSRLPNGDLLAIVDTNSTSLEPRMVRIDARSLVATAFASNNNPGAGATNAGTWSTRRGAALVLDTFANVLLAFSQGQSGGGAVINPSQPISAAGGSGEIATLIEVASAPCSGALLLYGGGLAGSGGYVPALTATGCPLAGQQIALHANAVLGGAPGVLVLGTTTAALPVLGGTLLVSPAMALNLLVSGPAGQPGAGALSVTAPLPPTLMPGARVFAQAVFFDPAAPSGFSFSGGLEIRIG